MVWYIGIPSEFRHNIHMQIIMMRLPEGEKAW